MLARFILMFIVLGASASALLFLMSYTDYFNKERCLRLARNAGLITTGFLIAFLALALLVAIHA